jgi:hypothetical protein
MSDIMLSKAGGGHTYYTPLQSAPPSLTSVTGQDGSSSQELEVQEQSQALENLEHGTGNNSDQEDMMMMPPPSFFDPTNQPCFTPSTLGASSTALPSVADTLAKSKGKHKDFDHDHDDSPRTLAHPPNSSKSISQSQSERSMKSVLLTMPEAVKEVGSQIQGLSQGLTTSFDHAANALEECTAHTITNSVEPIPLRKKRAIHQVQEEDHEDHEMVAIIEHFQNDVSIADSYLEIEKDSVHRLFLMKYCK